MLKNCSVHGRFQPLHLGHLNDYILPAKKKCEHLIIGITNPDPGLSLPDKTNLSRTSRQNNPLTYFERKCIIQEVLLDSGLKYDEFSIVPFPINFPQLIEYYVPSGTTHCLTIFDDWGDKKKRLLSQNKLKTHVLFKKDISEKKISSTMVRTKIINSSNWKVLVPEKVVNHIEVLQLKQRLICLRNL